MKFYDELKWRGLIKDEAGDDLADKLNNECVTFYWGTDPTADSLHLGHYSSLIMAKRLAKAGHHPILLVGGATGLIGDPRPTAEREIISKEKLNHNLESLKKQVTKIMNGNVEVVNNYDWFKGYEYTDVLRDVGKYITVNYLLNKDIIKRRLESGITFAEFAYTLIQGYDFLWLYQNKNCIMQVAGSDQWGNITTGIDLIKKKLGKDVYAFTMPLVTDKDGKKFGKSEGNALWLDENKTSSYELYQYLINVDDEMVISYLKIFTFLSVEEIKEIEKRHLENPGAREAHKILAREIITDLHGKESYEEALKISEDKNIVDLLVESGSCSSKREAREFIQNGSITFNGDKVTDLNFLVKKELCLHDKYLIIRRGKKKYFLGIYN